MPQDLCHCRHWHQHKPNQAFIWYDTDYSAKKRNFCPETGKIVISCQCGPNFATHMRIHWYTKGLTFYHRGVNSFFEHCRKNPKQLMSENSLESDIHMCQPSHQRCDNDKYSKVFFFRITWLALLHYLSGDLKTPNRESFVPKLRHQECGVSMAINAIQCRNKWFCL